MLTNTHTNGNLFGCGNVSGAHFTVKEILIHLQQRHFCAATLQYGWRISLVHFWNTTLFQFHFRKFPPFFETKYFHVNYFILARRKTTHSPQPVLSAMFPLYLTCNLFLFSRATKPSSPSLCFLFGQTLSDDPAHFVASLDHGLRYVLPLLHFVGPVSIIVFHTLTFPL